MDDLFIKFYETQGHTPGMINCHIQYGKTKLITGGDLLPGTPWVKDLILTKGNDRFPEKAVEEKVELLNIAAETNSWIFYPNDHVNLFSKIKRNSDQSEFDTIEKTNNL